jgi:sulfate/thiosulfate transport system ATP-binding protein
VVISHGRVEQAGTQVDFYDQPTHDFVMRFLGPVTQLRDSLVRPHDPEFHATDPGGGSVEGIVSGITRVGFEVRVEVFTASQVVTATLTRTELLALGIEQGSTVYLRVPPGAPLVPATSTPVDLELGVDPAPAEYIQDRHRDVTL